MDTIERVVGLYFGLISVLLIYFDCKVFTYYTKHFFKIKILNPREKTGCPIIPLPLDSRHLSTTATFLCPHVTVGERFDCTINICNKPRRH